MKNFVDNHKINILFLFFSLICTISILGHENISFQAVEWLHDGNESAIEQTAWYFFRNDLWRFPLGLNPNYGNEISSSVVFSDSIPLFALFFKIFKPILPENFQYFSLWYFLCFYFQLFFSYKILMKFTNSSVYSIIGSLFFIFAPIFIFRLNWHASVSAQWLLLFALYLGLTRKIDEGKPLWFLLIILSSLILYNFTIIILAAYTILRLFNLTLNKKNIYEFLKDYFVLSILLLLTLYFTGYFEIRMLDTVAVGFGIYKLNLLSFFDPVNSVNNISWSWFLPDIKLSKGEELEGFNYLGIGYILMILFSILLFLKNIKKKNKFFEDNNKNFKYFVYISIFLTLWALSNKISFGSETILEIPLNKYIFGFLSIYKATGRLFWIVNYFILICSIIIIYKCLRKRDSLILILLFLVIQIADVSAAFKHRIYYLNEFNNIHYLKDDIWKSIFKKHKVIKTTYPTSWPGLFHKFSLSMELNDIKNTNLAPHSRMNRKLAANARYDLYDKFNNKKVSDNTIYVIDNLNHLANLKNLFKNDNVGFFYRDKVWFMIANERKLMNDNDNKMLNDIKLKLLSFDENIELNFDNTGNYYGLGWSHNSGNRGIWSEGKKSTLLFRTKNSFNKIKLKINSEAYLNKKNKFLEFDILVNDIFNKSYKLSDDETEIEIFIDKKIIKNNEIKIDFIFKKLVSPDEVLESPDSRKLGLLIKSINITRI